LEQLAETLEESVEVLQENVEKRNSVLPLESVTEIHRLH
jgi:hypothetical protein